MGLSRSTGVFTVEDVRHEHRMALQHREPKFLTKPLVILALAVAASAASPATARDDLPRDLAPTPR